MINLKNVFCLFFFALLISFSATAQSSFDNPSFEGEAQDATVPAGWVPCARMTTPDILPGFWGVYTEPSDGETFVGIITRSSGTFESFTQRISQPLNPKTCYRFSVDLAHSRTYAGYNGKIKLKIWGGKKKCQKDQLLYDSGVIDNNIFETHKIEFTPEKKIRYIYFEASFDDSKPKPYNGNLLMDNLSLIVHCGRV